MSGHILIFAKTSHAKTPYDQWLAGSGIEPLILTTDEFAPGYSHLRHVFSFANYDRSQLVDKTALALARRFSLVGVFARAEADVIRAAQLRDVVDLPGQRTESALTFRNKVRMKDRLRGSGVLTPQYRVVDSAYTALTFVEEHGYPVVMKPFAESGSFGTQVIHDESELDQYLSDVRRDDMQIETFIDGQMYHVDGLIVDGELVFIEPFQYVNTCLSFRRNEFAGTFTIAPSNSIYDPLVGTCKAVLAALPAPRHMAFHCELWHTKDGRIVFCEIASRTGGGMISSTITHSFGFNIDQEWLYAECGLRRPFAKKWFRPAGGVVIPPLNGVLQHLPAGHEPDYVKEVMFTGQVGQRFHGGVKSGLFLAGYVVDGGSEEEVERNMVGVAAWFAQHARWQAVVE